MDPRLLLFLIVGTFLMSIPMVVIAKKRGILIWKAIVSTVFLTIIGTSGTYLMFIIENGVFGGLSFYGAVFLVPIVFVLVSLLLRISYGEILDLCAVGECIMLALMKVHCMLGGCCKGRFLFMSADGTPVLFPSREVELSVALVIFLILFYLALKKKFFGQLYPLYLLLYGSTRFVLNIFREAWVTKDMILPFGNIWSIVSIVLGLILLLIVRKKKLKEKHE